MKKSEELWAERTLQTKGKQGTAEVLKSLRGQCSAPHVADSRTLAKVDALSKLLASGKTITSAEPVAKEQVKHDEYEFNYRICKKYVNIKQGAESRGKDFALSISDVRRLLSIKKCQYTGVVMTESTGLTPISTDRTIDRLDNSKGYIKGNVFAVCHMANKAKNDILENSDTKVDIDFALTLLKNVKNRWNK